MRSTLFLIVSLLLLGCSKGERTISFARQIQPVLDKHCIKCHGGEDPRGKVVLTSYSTFMNSRTASSGQPLAFAGRPDDSRLYMLVVSNQPNFRMPPDTSGLPQMSKEEAALIRGWIAQGAKDN
jgi:hypothetical protein